MRMIGLTPKQFANLLKDNGWYISHRKSNHITYVKEGVDHHITITESRKEMSRPLVRRLAKEAGLLGLIS